MKTLLDEEVITNFLSTDPNACFETLYNRYVHKVYRRCLSITHDTAKAEDFTHDIFLKVFAKLDAFQGRSSFSTWLYSVSHNYCMDQLRLDKRMVLESINSDNQDISDRDDQAVVEEAILQLKRVMNSLPTKDTTLLRLKYEEGLSIEQIAQQYQIKASAVKMRLKRSRDKVYQLYQANPI